MCLLGAKLASILLTYSAGRGYGTFRVGAMERQRNVRCSHRFERASRCPSLQDLVRQGHRLRIGG